MLDKTYDPKQFEESTYKKTIEKFSPDESKDSAFCVLMPPPNVTGSLHLGHALTYTIQDILIRFKRQAKMNVLWQPGVDHAGIATQMVVERKLESEGIDPRVIGRDEFIKRTWAWKEESGNTIVEQQKRLGCSAPWELSRFTMDSGFSSAVIHAFVSLFKKGLIFRDKRLVNWDTKFKTAISDLEIQNKEEKGVLWHIKYQIAGSDEFITIATSRPETIFADVAIAVNPDDERYKKFQGMNAIIPFTNREIPIIFDEHADMEKGSGCVKITPAHDYNDFAVGKRHNLDMISILDENGHLISEYVPDEFRGVYLKKGRKLVVEKLKSYGLVVLEEEVVHAVPYGDRSGTVIEPFLTDQWFVDAKALAVPAIDAVQDGRVRFYPEKWENTYFDWMRNIEPWCISRQILWGHQIPAWYGPSGEIIVEKTEEEAFEAARNLGIDPDSLRRDQDVLDTWFSSALWPFGTLGWPEHTKMLETFYPSSTLVTGFDIIFFWVARMMMMSMHFMNDVPFKDIYVHALVRDEKGQKMSKSKGNVIDPLSLMDEFGADALRFTLAFLSVPGRDIKIGKDNVKVSRNFITKIWNAARFLQSKGVSFDKKITEIPITNKISHWIIGKLQWFKSEIEQNISDYRFDYAAKNIQFFIRDLFCDFFVEAMKVVDNDETMSVAGSVFAEFLRIANPFMPFVTDHLGQVLGICESFVLSAGARIEGIKINDEHLKDVDSVVGLIHEIRSKKQSGDEESVIALKKTFETMDAELASLLALLR